MKGLLDAGMCLAGWAAAGAPAAGVHVGWEAGRGSAARAQAAVVGADCVYTFPTPSPRSPLIPGLSLGLELLCRRQPGSEAPPPQPTISLHRGWYEAHGGGGPNVPKRLSLHSHGLGKSYCLERGAGKFGGLVDQP